MLAVILHKNRDSIEHFLEIFLFRDVVGFVPAEVMVLQAALLRNTKSKSIGIVGGSTLTEGFYHLVERLQSGLRTAIEAWTGSYLEDVPNRLASYSCFEEKFSDSSITNASSRLVDDASQRFLVVRIDRESQVEKHIFDFLALIERRACIDVIGNASLQEAVLYLAALGVGAVKDSNPFIRNACPMSSLHFSEDNVGFVCVAISREESNRISHLFLAEDTLRNLLSIVANQAPSSIHNSLRRAIIAFEFEESGSRISLAEMQDVINVRSSETINTLRIVANNTDTLPLVCEKFNYLMLSKVCILILIDKHKMETFLPVRCNLRIVLEYEPSVEQQIIEVHGVRLLQTLLIAIVNLGHQHTMIVSITLAELSHRSIIHGQNESVLCSRNTILDSTWLINLIVEIHLANDKFNEA